MKKQSAQEIRKEVLTEDGKKDISIYLSVPIGVVAGISSSAALVAVIVMRGMEYFRQGVDAYWLSCVPFLFPVVTGLFAAYKKQFGLLGVHLVVTLLALLLGGFGFGLSVEPIFLNRDKCSPASTGVTCDKASLAYLYLIFGSAAAGFAVLNFLMTLCGLYSATKRIAKRHHDEEVQHLRDVEEKQKELRQMKGQGGVSRTLSNSSHPTSAPIPTANGVSQASQAPPPKADGTSGGENSTTRL